MPRIVRTFVAASPSLKAEILDSLTKARQTVRQIEITMTDGYERRQRAWQIDDLPLDEALREIWESMLRGRSFGRLSSLSFAKRRFPTSPN
jgi:hypothetical protein